MPFAELLDLLDVAVNAIVHYDTDNGPHKNKWPDVGVNPFRCEKK